MFDSDCDLLCYPIVDVCRMDQVGAPTVPASSCGRVASDMARNQSGLLMVESAGDTWMTTCATLTHPVYPRAG